MFIDVLVSRSWLDLPHIHYHKQGKAFVIEINSKSNKVLSEDHFEKVTVMLVIKGGLEQINAQLITLEDNKVESQTTKEEKRQLLYQ